MKNICIIIFSLGIVFNLYSNNTNSITIEHIGEGEGLEVKLYINTRLHGKLIDYNNLYLIYCIRIQENILNEIIDLINNNELLFGEVGWSTERNILQLTENGTFKLTIENNEENYYKYLINRNNSVIFFNLIINILEINGYNGQLITELKKLPGMR